MAEEQLEFKGPNITATLVLEGDEEVVSAIVKAVEGTVPGMMGGMARNVGYE